jgi:hypothetical protein
MPMYDALTATRWCTVETWGSTAKHITFEKTKSEGVATRGCNQHVRMIESFARVAAAGPQGFEFWSNALLTTQQVLDALVASDRDGGAWTAVDGAAKATQ